MSALHTALGDISSQWMHKTNEMLVCDSFSSAIPFWWFTKVGRSQLTEISRPVADDFCYVVGYRAHDVSTVS